LMIQPIVKIMTTRAVVEEAKGRKSNETLHVEWSACNEHLER
jgi:hypothetical protein